MKLIINTKILIYCSLISAVILMAGMILGFKLFPEMVQKRVWENSILKENTSQWEKFVTTPIPFKLKVYFFNVVNPEEILQGWKPIVEEIGPYVYKINKWKTDIEWHSTNELSYYEFSLYKFDQESSGNLTDEDAVTILNSPYYSLILTVENLSSSYLETLNSVLGNIFKNNTGLFTRVKVREILFDGMKICENSQLADFGTKMICDQMKAKTKRVKPMRFINNTILFANLHYKNNTHLGRFRIKSGQENPEELNNLVQYNNKSYSNIWKGAKSKCNKIRGITNFRPYISPNMTFEAFGEDICRHMVMDFKEKISVKGVEGLKFSARNDSFDAPKVFSDDYCFCINKSRTLSGDYGCLKNGLVDMSSCLGAPIVLSFPHLLYADEEYISSVKGLQPIGNKHETFVVLEPISGTPLKMAKRVQFNMFIRPIEEIEEIGNISNSLIPMFWVEESMELPDEFIGILQETLFNKLRLLEIIKWGLIILGVVGLTVPLILVFYK